MKTIAYIDDDPIDTWLAVEVLKSMSCIKEIITATNGEMGWRTLADFYKSKHALPDLIFIDMLMPIKNGYDLIEEIKASSFYSENETRIILISEGWDETDLVKIKELKISDTLLKPLDSIELNKLINMHIRKV